MTIQFPLRPSPPRRLFHHAVWRRWWVRFVPSGKGNALDDVLLDPRMAHDLGLPPRPPAAPHLAYLGGRP